MGAYREAVIRGEIGRNAGRGSSTSSRRNSREQRAARRLFSAEVQRPTISAPGGRGWARDHTIELQHDLTGRRGASPTDYRWQDSRLNSQEGSRSWQLQRNNPLHEPAGGVARTSDAGRWYNRQGFRTAGRALGRATKVYAVVTTARDVTKAVEKSIEQESAAPVVAETVRQVGGWAAGAAGFKAGFAGGAALGIETGPGCLLTGLAGGLVIGTLGYIGADIVADLIDEN